MSFIVNIQSFIINIQFIYKITHKSFIDKFTNVVIISLKVKSFSYSYLFLFLFCNSLSCIYLFWQCQVSHMLGMCSTTITSHPLDMGHYYQREVECQEWVAISILLLLFLVYIFLIWKQTCLYFFVSFLSLNRKFILSRMLGTSS